MKSINQSFSKSLITRDFSWRHLLVFSSGILGTAFIGYRLFNSFKSKKNNNQVLDLFDDIDFETNLSKTYKPKEELEEIEKRLDEFKLSNETLRQIMEILENEMEKGLSQYLNSEADVKMLPTYVTQLPTGNTKNNEL